MPGCEQDPNGQRDEGANGEELLDRGHEPRFRMSGRRCNDQLQRLFAEDQPVELDFASEAGCCGRIVSLFGQEIDTRCVVVPWDSRARWIPSVCGRSSWEFEQRSSAKG